MDLFQKSSSVWRFDAAALSKMIGGFGSESAKKVQELRTVVNR